MDRAYTTAIWTVRLRIVSGIDSRYISVCLSVHMPQTELRCPGLSSNFILGAFWHIPNSFWNGQQYCCCWNVPIFTSGNSNGQYCCLCASRATLALFWQSGPFPNISQNDGCLRNKSCKRTVTGAFLRSSYFRTDFEITTLPKSSGHYMYHYV
jgi:hypothetical protein